MTELRRRGRPRSTGTLRCDRCENLVPKIRTRWPDGAICGPCFTTAVNTYGICAHCSETRMLPGRSPSGESICRDCANIRTNLTCDTCGTEAERLRRGQCAPCIITADLTAILKPNDPPDLRLHRLIRELATTDRPRSAMNWMRLPAPRFVTWLDTRLDEFHDRPHILQPLEQFGRWHHLRRLRADPPPKNMDYATRTAKQEITEAGKFLDWLDTEQRTKIDDLRQEQIDLYWSEGTSSRKHVRAFLQQRKLTGQRRTLKAKARTAETTPMVATRERLDAIRVVLESVNVIPSTRVAAIIFLLYGTPIGRIVALQADAITSTLDGMTIELGNQPAPIPESLIPLFNEHLNGVGSRSMNKNSSWLFPSTTPGQHISANTLWNRLKISASSLWPLATRPCSI